MTIIIILFIIIISLQDLPGDEWKQNRAVRGFPTWKQMSGWKVAMYPINHSGKVIPMVAAIYSWEVNYFFFGLTPNILWHSTSFWGLTCLINNPSQPPIQWPDWLHFRSHNQGRKTVIRMLGNEILNIWESFEKFSNILIINWNNTLMFLLFEQKRYN